MASLHGELTNKNAQLLEVEAENRHLREVSQDRGRLQQELDSMQMTVEQAVNKASDAIDSLQQVTWADCV